LINVKGASMLGAKERQGNKYGWRGTGVETTKNFESYVTMGDHIEATKGTSVIKHNISHERAIERAIGTQHGIAERVAQCLPGWFANFCNLSSHHVGVDYFMP
jgi:hypothetical protein